jgi:uncharacterized protein YuzE
MKLKYDPTVNAAYIRFCDKEWARTRRAPRNRGNVFIDYAKDGSVAGIEILGIRQGVDLTGVPEAEEVKEVLRASGFSAYTRAEWPPDWRAKKGQKARSTSASTV